MPQSAPIGNLPTLLKGGSRVISLPTDSGAPPHGRMSENLTPFEHRLLNVIESVSLNLADIEVVLQTLCDEICKSGLGEGAQRTLDQMG